MTLIAGPHRFTEQVPPKKAKWCSVSCVCVSCIAQDVLLYNSGARFIFETEAVVREAA